MILDTGESGKKEDETDPSESTYFFILLRRAHTPHIQSMIVYYLSIKKNNNLALNIQQLVQSIKTTNCQTWLIP